MATYMVSNEHSPEECEAMEGGLDHVPDHLKGKDFYCTCPFGRHGFYLIVEGESSEQVAQGLPAELFLGSTKIEQLEVFRLPS